MAREIPLRHIALGARFLGKLPSFLRRPFSLPEAQATLQRRFEQRESTFLRILEHAVYGYPRSPYRELLRMAGCEYGDLVKAVSQDGVEGTLRTLHHQGVYVTVDEFKGRTPAIRGSATIEVGPELLRNPFSSFHVPARTGGSRSQGTPVMFDLDFVRGCAINTSLFLDARGGSQWQKATWEAPGAGARFRLLKFCSFGSPPARWFSQIDPAAPGLPPIFKWSARAMRWGSRLAGFPMPGAIHAPLDDPLPIARWIDEVLRTGSVPHVYTFASSAVRLAEAALHAQLNMRGAQFVLIGEPITDARLAAIRRTGAIAVPRYGSIECGPIGYGCLTPEHSDDVHLLHDLHALIQPEGNPAGRLPDSALFVSALHPAAPFVFLNVSMGDQAVMSHRKCGCPLEQLGWVTHVHSIRSYEKLTGEGVTFHDTDVIRVLDEVLPARFGGSPTHYQLIEEESENGVLRLRLLVHPDVGPLDTQQVAEEFLTAIGSQSVANRLMESVWRDAKLLQVERKAPLSTRTGKILHLHLQRAPKGSNPGG